MAAPDTQQFRSLLSASQNIMILLSHQPDYDAVASALSLKISLAAFGKNTTIACPDPMTVEFNHLVGVDTIVSSFGNRNLVISFPGQTENVDKVSYNLEQGELQLVITPKTSAPDLDPRRLKFVSSGSSYDLIILVGVNQMDDLGDFYTTAKDSLSASKMVSLTRNLPAQNYTSYQLFDPQASSLSEITVFLLESMGLPVNTDAASNLLSGLEFATDHFRSDFVQASTFETATILMRRGARRHDVFNSEKLPPGAVPSAPPSPATPTAPTPSSQAGYGTDSQLPLVESSTAPVANPSPDWYEPKIYQGSMLP
jgi:hypothetical protein